MITTEAKWIGTALSEIPDHELFPLLNVGSQDEEFREKRQPWIDRFVFAPLRERDGQVIHLDLSSGPGVDVTGDLLDEGLQTELRARGVRSVLCGNVLEHVADRDAFAKALVSLVAPGAHLLVTCPNAFPYHPDPIDTMFRPSTDELISLFPSMVPEKRKVVRGTLAGYLLRRLVGSPRELMRSAAGSGDGGPSRSAFAAWMFRGIATSCVILKKRACDSDARG